MEPPKYYGKRVFIATTIFTAVTIGLVLYDEHRQKERRQVGVRNRILTLQQQANMDEYRQQQEAYEQYKTKHTAAQQAVNK